jgi:hypothetical protein
MAEKTGFYTLLGRGGKNFCGKLIVKQQTSGQI